MMSICHLFYNSWDSGGQILSDIGEYVPTMSDMGGALQITGDVVHEVAVRGGKIVGGTVGGVTSEFIKQDPDTAAAIGSALKGGTLTMALVIGTMLAISGYNMMNP